MQIRTIITKVEETSAERTEPVANRVRRAVVAAVLPNPWLNTSTRSNLAPAVEQIAPQLGLILTSYMMKILGPAEVVKGYGKGALIGLAGEWEHGAALLHTPYFGNVIRERLGGTEYISCADSHAAEGATITIPMAHKHQGGLRDYFSSISLTIENAPLAEELVVALAGTDGPRPNARIGDRTTDPPVKLAQFSHHYLFGKQLP
ncbi:hypothetical protein A5717_18125 [Mycolicibacterium porcinum]|nr:hypothetical protein A5717_18125 [Mycolicibacterium porcinum]